jgi:POT family proton-dependent oligopeptide transporter
VDQTPGGPLTSEPARPRTWLGHPVGLYILFLTQMWERFSFFGMLALLILYLNQSFKLSQDSASFIFKWYTSLIYFTPLIGGFLADRYLGNKRAVLLGALLMAVGHFLMVFPILNVLYAALILLVIGCGLLTPPLTTQVGLLYPPGDPRRDSAYTIFYMGINLGAFLSPLACGWLAENTRGRFHSGFTLAGIGMVIALATYLVGQRWVVEVEQGSAQSDDTPPPTNPPLSEAPPLASRAAESILEVPSAAPHLNRLAPRLLVALAALLALGGPPILVLTSTMSWDSAILLVLGVVGCLMFAWVAGSVELAQRDRVLAILLLGTFSVCYWAGGGQYGNVINLWAEQNTDRYLTTPAPPPELYAEATASAAAPLDEFASSGFWERWVDLFRPLPRKEAEQGTNWGQWWASVWNPMPTAWFQSINPLLILLLAPLFAGLWTALDRRGFNPSIPAKMGLGLLLMALAFGLMLVASWREAQPTSVPLVGGRLPDSLAINEQGQICRVMEGTTGQPYAAGRLFHDHAGQSIRALGGFSDLARDEILRDTAPPDTVKAFEELQEQTVRLASGPSGWVAQIRLARELPNFDLRLAGLGQPQGNREISYDPASRSLKATIVLEDKELKGLQAAAGDAQLRATLNELLIQSNATRVSAWWLAGFFLLATLGELCLSPVGMSMVSQLAPARFATMLMGMWLLTFAFGNYLAGACGEKWGTWAPTFYFGAMFIGLSTAVLVLLVLVRRINTLIHEGH